MRKIRGSLKTFFIALLLMNSVLINGQLQTIYDSSDTDINILAFITSQALKKVYFADNNHLYIYDLVQKRLENQFNLEHNQSTTTSISITPDGKRIFLGMRDGNICSYNSEDGVLTNTINLNSGAINSMNISCDEYFLIVGCENGSIHKVDLSDFKHPYILHQQDSQITNILLDCKNQLLIASGSNGHIILVDWQTLSLKNDYPYNNEWIRDIDFNETQNIIYCVGDDGCLTTLKVALNGVIKEISKEKISSNWLTSVKSDANEGVLLYGGVDQKIYANVKFGTYHYKMKGPIIKADIYRRPDCKIELIVSVYSKGLIILPLEEMSISPL